MTDIRGAKTAAESVAMEVSITRRAMLKNTAKAGGGALAISLLGGMTALAGAVEADKSVAVSEATALVIEIEDDNFWIGGF
jgi:hypothetical protein